MSTYWTRFSSDALSPSDTSWRVAYLSVLRNDLGFQKEILIAFYLRLSSSLYPHIPQATASLCPTHHHPTAAQELGNLLFGQFEWGGANLLVHCLPMQIKAILGWRRCLIEYGT